MSIATENDAVIGDFSNDEIRSEYIERFGDPDDWDLGEISDGDLKDEHQKRFGWQDAEAPDGFDEILDLIAEAARGSRHAAKAYQLLRDAYPNDAPVLAARQRLIAGRMGDVA